MKTILELFAWQILILAGLFTVMFLSTHDIASARQTALVFVILMVSYDAVLLGVYFFTKITLKKANKSIDKK